MRNDSIDVKSSLQRVEKENVAMKSSLQRMEFTLEKKKLVSMVSEFK
jgi:hypothetical protein